MKFRLTIIAVLMLSVLCIINTTGYAENNDYVKFEETNVVCTGINGEKVMFITEGSSKEKAILQVKNMNTGAIDLTISYEPGIRLNKRLIPVMQIQRMNIDGRSFWVIAGRGEGFNYACREKCWVVGEYKGKYTIFLTEKIFDYTPFDVLPYFGYIYLEPSDSGQESRKMQAVIYLAGGKSKMVAFWDKEAEWFGYADVKQLTYGGSYVHNRLWHKMGTQDCKCGG